MKVNEILLKAANQLKDISASARLDAELLLAFILKKNRTFLFTHFDLTLSPEICQKFIQICDLRSQGTPVAYIMKQKEFWSLPLTITPDVLIPRSETELIVDLALKIKQKDITLIDLGTGCGAIAIALAHERPNWHIYASDINNKALNLAKKNANNLNQNNIRFLYSDWFDNLPVNLKFDIVVTNPPYIAKHDPALDLSTKFEPATALFSGEDGLADLKKIIAKSRNWLKTAGTLIMEHGYQQKQSIIDILTDNGYKKIKAYKDYNGLDRVVTAFWPG